MSGVRLLAALALVNLAVLLGDVLYNVLLVMTTRAR